MQGGRDRAPLVARRSRAGPHSLSVALALASAAVGALAPGIRKPGAAAVLGADVEELQRTSGGSSSDAGAWDEKEEKQTTRGEG